MVEHLSRAAGVVRRKVSEGQGGRLLAVDLQHVLAARNRLAQGKCFLGGDVLRPQWMEGLHDEVCYRFRRSLQALVGDMSISSQPEGWAPSRASLLFKGEG